MQAVPEIKAGLLLTAMPPRELARSRTTTWQLCRAPTVSFRAEKKKARSGKSSLYRSEKSEDGTYKRQDQSGQKRGGPQNGRP